MFEERPTDKKIFFEGEHVVIEGSPWKKDSQEVHKAIVGEVTRTKIISGTSAMYYQYEILTSDGTYLFNPSVGSPLERLTDKILPWGTRMAEVVTDYRYTMRRLNPKDLPSELNVAYREAERLAQEYDETGRAAALATLKNLNSYLQNRQKSKTQTAP